MSEKKTSWVLVLEDVEGAIYTITPEILRLGIVATSEHESEILNHIKSSVGPSNIEDAFPGFKVLGSYAREVDKKIKRTYIPPLIKIISKISQPNP